MGSNTAKLRAVAARAGGATGASGTTSGAISDDLRRLQEQRRTTVDADGILAGLVPGLSALLAGDRFVSLSRTRDGRSIRVSVKDGNDWIEFYTDDPDAAEELGAAIAAAFSYVV